ncbi:MAG: hypothetical protein IJ893_02570 [Bacteroidales bacterium]|nr:hypothetical protein [Bacteroidales bacterium]
MALTEKLLSLIGVEPMTNREAVLEELMEMSGADFFVNTGLVFNEEVHAEMNGQSYEEWLDKPATIRRFFKEDPHGEIRHHCRSRSAEAVL